MLYKSALKKFRREFCGWKRNALFSDHPLPQIQVLHIVPAKCQK